VKIRATKHWCVQKNNHKKQRRAYIWL